MSFIYNRRVAISRPVAPTGVGVQSYGGQTLAAEASVAKNLPASIQLKKVFGTPETGLPGDANKSHWRVFIPASAAAPIIAPRDIATDDAGQRYLVLAPDSSPLGYTLWCERLET